MPDQRQAVADKFSRYIEAFGTENGHKWFSQNRSFSDCLEEQCGILKEEPRILRIRLQAAEAACE